MKAFFLFFFSFLFFENGKAQQKYDSIFPMDIYREDWALVIKNAKFGFIDTNGIVVVKPIYDTIYPFRQYADNSEDWALVIIDKKKGFIDGSGKEIVKPIYDEITFREDELIVTKNHDKYGLLSNQGKIIFNPIFDSIYHYPEQETENHIRISMNSKIGYIYIGIGSVRILIPAKYDSIGNFNYLGLAIVKVNGRYGYINYGGKEVVKPIYDSVSSLSDAGIYVKKDNIWGLFNEDGKTILPLSEDSLRIFKIEWKEWPKKYMVKKYGLVNNKGKVIAKPIYDKIYPFDKKKSGFAEVELNGKKGFIDVNGKYFSNQ